MTLNYRLLIGSLLVALVVPLQAADAIWQEFTLQGAIAEPNSRLYRADEAALRGRLALAPHEALLDDSLVVELPMPDGELQSFVVVESPIMVPELAARLPQVKTFKLTGIDDPGASGRADLTAKGFRAMLHTSQGVVLIDPAKLPGQAGIYRSLNRRDQPTQDFACGVHQFETGLLGGATFPSKPVNRQSMNYQTYRIAVSATSEYVTAVGNATAEITTAINRVNQIYERDLGIRLLLVANDGTLIEADSENCFSNGNPFAMLDENQVWIDERIGDAAYDIGHVFGVGPGGVAGLGSTCQTGAKARGVTTLSNPTGDPFYIDFVAHEIGHQMNANHSFNGTTGACAGNRFGATAFEPGSGSTIMSYSGICGAENLQTNSDATFHAGSISEINLFTTGGGSCNTLLFNGNTDPSVTPIADRTIPANTPFRLAASASDINGDTLTYQWDQLDSGDSTTAGTFGTDLANNPLFRTYEPQLDSWRDFPALGTQVLGQTDLAEVLPTTARTLDFRVTVRDGASGQTTDDVRLTVVTGTGFRVTSQSTAGPLNTTLPYNITWNRANTHLAPVNCALVDIDLLTFDDASYTNYGIHSIAAGVPNNESFTGIPLSMSHPRARIRVKCSNNVFYDISNADLNVTGTNATLYADNTFSTFFNSGGLTVSKPGPASMPSAVASAGSELIDVFAGLPMAAAQIDECTFDPTSNEKDATALDPRLAGLLLLLAAIRLARRYGWH